MNRGEWLADNDANLDAVLAALADPTRRAVLRWEAPKEIPAARTSSLVVGQ
jgi:DNA-binding transcriptional ArsR family regulator